MTLQNLTTQHPSVKRVPQIIEKELEGKTQIEIAQDLGVSRMTVYTDRNTDLYQTLVNEFLELYIDKIKEFMTSEQATIALEGTKEAGRIVRSGITRQTKHTEDINLRATIDITEKRKQNEELIKVLELTPDQYRILEENVKPENLE